MNVIKIKAAVRKRDGNRCVQCGMTNEEHRQQYGRQLEVHRKTPGVPYVVEDCETLCKICHAPKPRSPHGSKASRWVRFPADIADRVEHTADALGLDTPRLLSLIAAEHLPEYEHRGRLAGRFRHKSH